MRVGLLLLLIAAGAVAVQAGSSRNLLQDSNRCPIDNCNNNACAYNSRRQSWTCSSCQSPLVPNQAKSACVCPAGQYPIIGTRRCAPCPKGFYCPRGNVAGQSTAKACPRNMVTVAVGAKTVTDCVNKPGFKYMRTATGVRAVPCEEDTYSPGLAKQTQCTKCPPGFKTDPELVPGTQTSSKVCVAAPGYFVAGDTTAPCPQGEFNDKYDMATSCTPCSSLFDEEYAVGITTLESASTSQSECRVAEPGYVLVNEKKTAILTAPGANSGYKLGGAKLCPQKYFCPGGDVLVGTAKDLGGSDDIVINNLGKTGVTGGVQLWSSGIPIGCPGGLWTEDEGAKTFDACVAPPGFFFEAPSDGPPVAPATATECPSGTYKEEWNRATGCKSCEDPTVSTVPTIWLSGKTIYINDMDATTGLVNRQVGTRGSPDSCYIQKGMGTLTVRASDGLKVTLRARVCPADSYGIDAEKKYGRTATPCTPCPANMVTTAAGNTDRALTYVTGDPDADPLVTANTDAGTGYFSISACLTQAGYGYYNGAAQKCPKGTYSAGGEQMPCITCPTGTTTNAALVNDEPADCNLFMAGYGLVEGVTAQCPLGTYGTQDRAVADAECDECSLFKWTPAIGAMADAATTEGIGCTRCAAGYGDDTWDPTEGDTTTPTCASCQDGLYGDLTRTNPRCQICPIDRTFSYAYGGAPDVVSPRATSPASSASISQCVTDFQQVVDGAFFIDFVTDADPADDTDGLVGTDVENVQACVEQCRVDANCVAAHFNYDPDGAMGQACSLWKPVAALDTDSDGAVVALAWKTMPSTVQAQSDPKTKAMGSGLYSFYWGVNAEDAAKGVDPTSVSANIVAASTVQLCLDECSNDNLCAGVSMTVDSPAETWPTINSCKKVLGTVQPGNSLRTLTKTRYTSLQAEVAP